MQKIRPCLWFDGNAEEAVNYYVSIFDDSRIGKIMRNNDATPGPAGSVLAIDFTLYGQSFQALNGGPQFKFNEAISLSVDCEGQAEVDKYWNAFMRDGGKGVACGWLKDKYGLSWQIVPRVLHRLMNDSDQARAARVTRAMMKMVKIDVAEIERAAKG